MDNHGVARPKFKRTEEQRQQDSVKIEKYRALENEVREKASAHDYSESTFNLTTKLLRANPEYYTVWNIRRRCLISGLLSARSRGSLRSTASQSTSVTDTHIPSSDVSSTSSSTATRHNPDFPTTGSSGLLASADDGTGSDVLDNAAHELDSELLRSELVFTVPLLLNFPKCYWIWNHRSWTLQQAIERLQTKTARRIWEEELGLATKMLTKDHRNFHAWGYRRNVVSRLESAALGGSSLAESEFSYTTAKITQDLSNFSAWHHRSRLIPRLLDERGADGAARKKLLDEELSWVRDALNVGPEDQSLWYYHQFLILNIVERDPQRTFVPDIPDAERVEYIDRELEDIKDLLEDYQDIKLIYEALMEYTLSRARLVSGGKVDDEGKEDIRDWLGKLRELDPMRMGRWDDVEKSLGL